jgi:nondiscriminating glutamyl-tRNA synthetase
VLLGFHPGDDREILSRAELLEAFTLDRIGSSGSVFDPDKLRWVNAHYLHHASGAELKGWIERELDAHDDMQPPMWAEAYQQLIGSIAPQMIERALEIVRGNLTTLDDAPRELGYLLAPIDPDAFDPDAQQALASNGAAEVCSAFAEALAALAQWRADAIKSALQQVGADLGVKGKSLFQPVRAALTGRTHGPELPVLAEFIDRDRCIERLRRAEGWSHNHARSAQ